MNLDEMKAAIEAMAREKEERFSEARKPTPTEVRQGRAQFAVHPQSGIPTFTLACLYCNTGIELDFFAARVGEAIAAFCGRHKACMPECLPPLRQSNCTFCGEPATINRDGRLLCENCDQGGAPIPHHDGGC